MHTESLSMNLSRCYVCRKQLSGLSNRVETALRSAGSIHYQIQSKHLDSHKKIDVFFVSCPDSHNRRRKNKNRYCTHSPRGNNGQMIIRWHSLSQKDFMLL